MKKAVSFVRCQWEWLVLTTTLITLALFLMGHNLYGLSGPLSSLLALLGGLLGTLASFLLAALIIPLAALVTGSLTAVIAAVTGLASMLIGGIFTPLAALLTGWATSIFSWLMGTWLGTLLSPLYNILAPLVLKIAPWITVSKSATRAWDTANHLPLTRRWLHKFGLSGKARRAATTPNRSADRGRSSVRGKPGRARPHRGH